MHLQLNLQTFLPGFTMVDTAKRSNGAYAHQLCANLKEGEIIVLDKAYVDFAHLFELDRRGVFWVTRWKDNLDCRCVKQLAQEDLG